MDLWQIAYHLCGITLLGKSGNALEPLAELPMPVRSAVLRLAHQLLPEAVVVEESQKSFDYVEGSYTWIDHWYCLDQTLFARINDPLPLPQMEFLSVDDYFTTHKLYPQAHYPDPKTGKPSKKGPHGETVEDEHFAERLFVEKVFVPTFGLTALAYLQPQVLFGKKGQRIDFVLEGQKLYAIEIEGYTYHRPNRLVRFIAERRRLRALVKHGYTYYPFAYQDIQQGNAVDALNELLADPVVQKHCQPQAPGQIQPTTEAEVLLKGFAERYQAYQQLVLALLWQAAESGKQKIVLGDFQPRFPLLAIALYDTIAVLEKVALLYDLPLTLPVVEIYVVGATGSHYQCLLDLYHQAGPQANGRNSDAPSHPITYKGVVDATSIEFTYYSQAERQRHAPIENAQSFAAMTKYSAPFLAQIGPKLPEHVTVANPTRCVLDFFVRRYFRVPELKHEQLLLLQRSLRNESSIGILPTGFGKSLVFQLYAIIMPRANIVISPLKALMRDQLYHLHKLGFSAVDAITMEDSTAEKDEKLKAFLDHRYRLLYISPERLQIKSFQHQLRTILAKLPAVPLGALVIDEAHCVSEWGHDFRPAYLQIGYFRRQCEAALNRKIVTLGLTATASKRVRQDIVTLLELEDNAVVQLSRSDRSNLSFSVHAVPDTMRAKLDALKSVICMSIPQALKIDDWRELIPVGQKPPFSHAGVVFTIYAAPQGRIMLEEGAPAIAHRIIEQIVPDESLVQVFAAKPTTRCPKCKSVLFIKRTSKHLNDKVCLCQNPTCKHQFTEAEIYIEPNWEQTLIQRQEAFHANQFPVLVATKGFGMGIDKRNIRYVIHHALARSMEGYFQEAGRAGRDGKHAHVVLIYKPPTPTCYANHLSRNQAPPCITDQKCKKFMKCPYGLSSLCDAGRQAHFIDSNYPGQDKDCKQVTKIYSTIKLKQGVFCEPKSNNFVEICLYRLQQLGVISNYALEYQGERIRYEVDVQSWNLTTLETNLRAFLRKTRSSETAIEAQLARLRSSIAAQPQPPDSGMPPLLQAAVEILLERIYAEFPKMRYAMLGNLLRYATSEQQNICRRVEIRSTFDGDDLILDGYRCGFCDVCQPDLNFQLDRAEIPLLDAEIHQVSKLLPQLLESFDAEKLSQLVQVAVNKGAVPGLYAKVSGTLEHDATNVAALYLAGALALRQDQFVDAGFEQLRFCYQEARRQGLAFNALYLIYQEAKPIRPMETFLWANEVNGPFDHPIGLAYLEQDAIHLFGVDSPIAANLRDLRQIRTFQELQHNFSQLTGTLSALADGFADLEQTKGNGECHKNLQSPLLSKN